MCRASTILDSGDQFLTRFSTSVSSVSFCSAHWPSSLWGLASFQVFLHQFLVEDSIAFFIGRCRLVRFQQSDHLHPRRTLASGEVVADRGGS